MFSKKRKRKILQSNPVDTIENKTKNCEDIRKNKMVIEFNDHKYSSVKSIAVKSQTNIKCTSQFRSGKLLMFAKLSIKSFVYSLVELLHFPEENPIVASIYEKYDMEQINCYQILTDIDSTSIQFIIVSDPASTYHECNVRDILFETFSKTKIRKRFDKSDEFWRCFNVHDLKDQKVLGLYEVEHIDGLCYVTLGVNPKEYFEYFKSELINKNTKELKKVLLAWNTKTMQKESNLYYFNTYKKPKQTLKM